MLSFKSYLKESKQVGTLYHFTKPDNLERLLDEKLQKSYGVPGVLHLLSHNGYISTTRNHMLSLDPLQLKHHHDLSANNGYVARITLDGDNLSNHYKIKPVLGLKDNSADVFDVKSKGRVSRHEHENEELVKSDMLPIRHFIKRIDFIHSSAHLQPEQHQRIITKLNNHGIEHGIAKMWHNHGGIKENYDEYGIWFLIES